MEARSGLSRQMAVLLGTTAELKENGRRWSGGRRTTEGGEREGRKEKHHCSVVKRARNRTGRFGNLSRREEQRRRWRGRGRLDCLFSSRTPACRQALFVDDLPLFLLPYTPHQREQTVFVVSALDPRSCRPQRSPHLFHFPLRRISFPPSSFEVRLPLSPAPFP